VQEDALEARGWSRKFTHFSAEATHAGGEDCDGGIVSFQWTGGGDEAFGVRPKPRPPRTNDPAYLAAFFWACAVSLREARCAAVESGFCRSAQAFEDAGLRASLGGPSAESTRTGFFHFDQQQAIVGDHHGDADIVTEGDQALPLVSRIYVHWCEGHIR